MFSIAYIKNHDMASITALTTLQNGRLPRILGPDLVEELFVSDSPRRFIQDLRKGIDSLGLYQVLSVIIVEKYKCSIKQFIIL